MDVAALYWWRAKMWLGFSSAICSLLWPFNTANKQQQKYILYKEINTTPQQGSDRERGLLF